MTNRTVGNEAGTGTYSPCSIKPSQSRDGEVRTVQANATDEAFEPIHTGLYRNPGTERSIGMELQHLRSSADGHRVANHSDRVFAEPLTPKELDKIYSMPYANVTIDALIALAYVLLALFATALTGFLPLDPITPLCLTILWAVWYFWGFVNLFWVMCRKTIPRWAQAVRKLFSRI